MPPLFVPVDGPSSGRVRETARIVVIGYSGSAASTAALTWAAASFDVNDRLLVVHATSVPVTVYNGPSNVIAETLDTPMWATVRRTVDQLVGRERADTLVEHGRPVDVLTRHGATADMVVLGQRPRRSRLFRRLLEEIPCAVIGVRPDGRFLEGR